jgi:hypothetical protein
MIGKMDKKGDMPFWLVMMILILAGLVVVLLIIFAASGKLQDFLAWLTEVF